MKKIIIIVFCFVFTNAQAVTIYVNKDLNTGSSNGTSWANAFRGDNALYLGIAAAVAGDDIWVRGGTYRTIILPTGCSGCGDISLTNRNNSYLLKSGVRMYGNFAGTETAVSQRSFSGNETILTGNIGNLFINTDDAYHVITAVSCNNTTLLDKFTIQEGNANGAGTITIGGKTYFQVWGGGMLSVASSVRVQNCSFVNNRAESGGGMLNTDSSTPTIVNSIFVNNTADGGAGIYNHNSSSPILTNCTIANNTGTIAGGAMYNLDSNPTVHNSIIWGNTSPSFPSIANNGGTPVVSSSIVQGGYAPCTDCPATNGNTDPLFVNAADPNGQDNRWGNADDGLSLSNCSPAIDKLPFSIIGGGTTDIAGQTKPFDVPFRQNAPSCGLFCVSSLDLGAYESQSTTPDKIYVNASNMSFQTGTSWALAFTDLSDAIAAACPGNEIWVAAGTYTPNGYPAGCTGCATNRDYAFLLKDDVKLYGGFGGTENNLSQRNIALNRTEISGEINTPTADDNVYHILLSLNNGNGTILDGFIILGGGVNTFNPAYPSTTIQGKSVIYNEGGGLYTYQSRMQVSNCEFLFNIAHSRGGGIHNENSNDIFIENSNFYANAGSAIYNLESNAIIQRCSFNYNTAVSGGGINNTSSSAKIENCTFVSNFANNSAGAILNYDVSSPTITNCTVVSNTSLSSQFGGGIVNTFNCTPTITNTILWNNAGWSGSGNMITEAGATATVSNSIVQGGYTPCTTCPNSNGNVDPQFLNIMDSDGPDNINRTFDDGIILRRTSPAINAGTNVDTPHKDILGNYRTGQRDLGAYEFIPKGDCISSRFVGDNPIESGTHVSLTNITTNGTVGTGTSVIFEASNTILLLPGFTTQNTSVFKAEIKPTCAGPS